MTTQLWTDALAQDAVPDEDVTAVEVQGRELAFYGVGGQVYATDNICTHGHARLSDGFLEGSEIECPLHQGKFDVCSGKAMCAPLTVDLRTYPVKIENGRVYVDLGDI
ncbi:non-heme iron oxygenase ferredoxin subunit [Duganella radicis]|uniref:Rieske 2Fe-2S domain-containing protein n=1 Tax=Duganella radicis TaxID=551988 RepID=A0A6L6PAI8_9BURK|nr:non-heme iron oxygenase ferredoxin subunit [Duganella radicis]MTV35978.1 Rieske 2Fe-2S domain-containing protein [Duganella radicis]